MSRKFTTFSDTLIPPDPPAISADKRDVEAVEARSAGFYDKLSVAMDRSGFQAPSSLEAITQVSAFLLILMLYEIVPEILQNETHPNANNVL